MGCLVSLNSILFHRHGQRYTHTQMGRLVSLNSILFHRHGQRYTHTDGPPGVLEFYSIPPTWSEVHTHRWATWCPWILFYSTDMVIICVYLPIISARMVRLGLSFITNRHVNATKSYLHFDRFAGEAILCSNFFCFLLFLDVLFLS